MAATIKRSVRLNEETAESLSRIAQEKHCTETAVIEAALKLYSDHVYMKEHASVIPQEILAALQSTVGLMERRLNNRSNQLISALAIEVCTLQQVIAASLDVDPGDVKRYRKNAADWLKANQRVFRMEEALE